MNWPRTSQLDVVSLNAFYGQAHILFDVDFTVHTGEVVALLGRNGAGKSTTFLSIMAMVARRTGTVWFDADEITHLPTYEIARRGLGFVPENRRIFSDLTVEENLLVGRQAPREGAPTWEPEKLFSLFPNLAEMRKRPGGRMSGGEQQMLTIARTLMGNPSLVLLDEPSEGLAPKIVEQMAAAILAMKQEGLSILLSEQNLHFARLISDRAVILEKGRVQFTGTLAELDARPDVRDAYLAV
ncbi:MAG: ABC transporter ATP-binding protein [Rhodoplanes sp.]|uniref:ABC transporter ATP-binding protein n=1 Tax=Rhodoplanes sp. TaxID=1968906 RepID=UPI0017956612|nr:ABC transporter ATP-binding protein [Rhodoplanes sp.]NVO13140.1 ABC transporter ATP-binding protein [Rhodoplanes sp.]